MRTDSTRISQTAKDEAKSYIEEKYGTEYTSNRKTKGKQGIKMPMKLFVQQVHYVHQMK